MVFSDWGFKFKGGRMALKINIIVKEPGIFVVTLYGPLDTTTYAALEKQIEPLLVLSTKVIILNMEGVNYISSMGIGTLFKIKQAMMDNNGSLVVTNLQPQIQKVLETVKAMPEAIFTSYEEVDEYLTELQKKFLDKEHPPTI